MDEDDNIFELICALSDDQHFSQDPLVLTTCPHTCCKKCAIKEVNTQFKCKICDVQTDRDIRNDKVSSALKRMIKISLNSLLNNIKSRMSSKLDSVKGIIKQIVLKNNFKRFSILMFLNG